MSSNHFSAGVVLGFLAGLAVWLGVIAIVLLLSGCASNPPEYRVLFDNNSADQIDYKKPFTWGLPDPG